jgi:DNA-binding LacI/PurR family transcriptional regulator
VSFSANISARRATFRAPRSAANARNKIDCRAICVLATLHRPLALLTCSDILGQHVLDACRRIGAAVPEEIAVVSVDDDALLCELC